MVNFAAIFSITPNTGIFLDKYVEISSDIVEPLLKLY